MLEEKNENKQLKKKLKVYEKQFSEMQEKTELLINKNKELSDVNNDYKREIQSVKTKIEIIESQ